MQSILKKLLVMALVGFLVLPSLSYAATADANQPEPILPAPTIYSPQTNSSTFEQSVLITGVTFNGTRVAVYIDNTFNGYATVKEDLSGVASWAYFPFLPLTYGSHQIFARAESLTSSTRSEVTTAVSFEVTRYFIAPTLFEPVVNVETTYQQPFIVGLAANDCQVAIYIDGELDGKILVENHSSGTANFRYLPQDVLGIGNHSVKAVAYSLNGSESLFTEDLIFNIAQPVGYSPSTQIDDSSEAVSQIQDSEESILEEETTLVEEQVAAETAEAVETSEGSDIAKQAAGWSILGVLLVGIVYQRRDFLTKIVRRKKSTVDSVENDVEIITSSKSASENWEPKPEEKKNDDPGPTPPPPASQY